MAGELVARHQPQRARAEQAHAVELAAAEQHAREAQVVRGARHEPAAAGEAVGRAGRRDGRRAAGGAARLRVGRVERGEPIVVGLVGVEAGLDHAERPEHARREELVERLAGDDLDDAAEHVGRDAVVPLAAGLEEQRQSRPRLAAGREVHARRRAPLEAGRAVEGVDGVGVVEAVGQPGGVGEQVPHPDRLGRRHGHDLGHRAAAVDAHVGELGQEAGDRVLELEVPLLPQHHRRDRGDRLRHRVDAPQRVRLDGQVGLDVAPAAALDVGLVVAVHDDEPAREAAVLDVAVEVRAEAPEARGVDAAHVATCSINQRAKPAMRSTG